MPTAGVEATISIQTRATQVGSGDLGTPRAPSVLDIVKSFTAGTANDNQANLLYSDTITLTTGQTANLDMAGVLATALGATITAAEVVAIVLQARSTNTTNIAFFGAAANSFNGPLTGTTPTLTLKPGDVAVLISPDGWTVTAGTGDILSVVNAAGASADYDVLIIARTIAS